MRAHERCATGVAGADEVLSGGVVAESATLLRGAPGAGKTIFGLHFLTAEPDETGLYVNLGEPSSYLRSTVSAFGLQSEHARFLDLSPSGDEFRGDSSYTLFHTDEVERSPITESIRERVDRSAPDRVVVDPITELRHLTADDRQFHTHVLGLIDFLKRRDVTLMLCSQAAPSVPDDDLQFLADTVLTLSVHDDRRSISVSKFRGASARRGEHALVIDDNGMRVWPRLDPARHTSEAPLGTLPAGVAGLDALLDGGITTGAITFLSGPTGVGKTTTTLQFMTQAAQRGEQCVLYSFEESRRTMIERADSMGIPVSRLIEAGSITIESIDPGEMSIDEFTSRLTAQVDAGTSLVGIDGVAGFERTFSREHRSTTESLVRIGRYLRNVGVTGLFTNGVHQITGNVYATEDGISHLADDIIVFRHIERDGELQKCIGVLKRRVSPVDTQLRLLSLGDDGLEVGDSLSELRGILTGTPHWVDVE